MIKPIRTEEQYEKSLERAYELMQKDIKLNTEDADELEIISILIKNYEDKNFPLGKPNSIEAIKFRLEQMNVK